MIERFYHRPVLRRDPAWPAKNGGQDGSGTPDPVVLEVLAKIMTGSLTLEVIFGSLISSGFEVEQIVQALSWLDQHELIQEAPESELSVLSDGETERYAGQMRILAAILGSERTGISSPLPVLGLSAQIALKESLVLLLGAGMNAEALARALLLAGVGRLVVIPLNDDERVRSESLRENLQRINPAAELAVLAQAEDLSAALSEAPANLVVYCPDWFDETVADWLNEACLAHSVPFLPFRKQDLVVEMGPLVIPHETACYTCYDLRRKATQPTPIPSGATAEQDTRHLNFPIGADWLALEVVKHLVGVVEPVTRSRLWQFNIMRGLATVHPVLKLPRCPACGVHRHAPLRRLWKE